MKTNFLLFALTVSLCSAAQGSDTVFKIPAATVNGAAIDVSVGLLDGDGNIASSGEGTIILPSDWSVRFGRWKLFTASNIESSVRGWTASGILNGKQYTARLILEDDGVYLAINGPGTEIIIR